MRTIVLLICTGTLWAVGVIAAFVDINIAACLLAGGCGTALAAVMRKTP